jgi:hypothetical protein
MWSFAKRAFNSIDMLSLKLKLLFFLNPMAFIVENMCRCPLEVERENIADWQFVLPFTLNQRRIKWDFHTIPDYTAKSLR